MMSLFRCLFSGAKTQISENEGLIFHKCKTGIGGPFAQNPTFQNLAPLDFRLAFEIDLMFALASVEFVYNLH